MSQIESNIFSSKKLSLLNNYLDMIMKSTESQYGYIFKVNRKDEIYNYSRLVEMYYMREVKSNLLMDTEFNFLDDIYSTLEFYHQQVIDSGKPLILDDCKIEKNLFTFDNSSIYEKSAWFIIPVLHYGKIVAIIGMIGCPIKFNIFYYEMFQPFLILCSQLISSVF